MSSSLRRNALAAIAITVAIALGTGAAWAFWSAGGAGAATATTGTLNPPTDVSATAAAGTVTISWTGSTKPTGSSDTLTYDVFRSGQSSVACSTTAPTTTCNDTGVPTGTYTYTVKALLGSWTATSDATSSVEVNAATKLAITSTAVSGSASNSATLGPITVQRQDTNGNGTTATSATTVTLSSDSTTTAAFAATSGGSAVTSVTIPANATSTTFYYGDTKAGTPTITAAASGLDSGGQTETISAATASKLAFGVQPSNTVAGASISPAPTVQIQDQFGNLTASTDNVTLAIGTNPSSGTLSGTATVAAVSGTATFNGLSINKVGAGYKLAATSGTLTGATSSAFNITPGAAKKLVITSAAVSGAASNTATLGPITVQLQDANNNATTATTDTTVNLSSDSTTTAAFAATSGGSAVTSVTIPANATSTTFYYGDTKAGAPTITAAASGLTSGGQTETISAATASKLAFGVQPDNTVAGASISPAPTVQIQDQFGNVTASSDNVTLAIGTNPSSGTLSGTTTVAAVSGTATFNGLSINKVGTGYKLAATSGTLTGATSSSFNVTPGAAKQLVITSAAVAGAASNTAALGPITVQLQDANGNATTSTTDTTVNLSSDSAGTAVFAATSGGSAVTSVTIPANATSTTFYYGDTKAGTSTITVHSSPLTDGTQAATISAGPAAAAVFTHCATTGTGSSATCSSTGGSSSVSLPAGTSGRNATPAGTWTADVTLIDAFGNVTTNSGSSSLSVTVSYAGSSSTKGTFGSGNGSATATTTLTVAAGSSTSTGTFTFTPTSNSSNTYGTMSTGGTGTGLTLVQAAITVT